MVHLADVNPNPGPAYQSAVTVRHFAYGFVAVVAVVFMSVALFDWVAPAKGRAYGEVMDSYLRVPVYFNGRVSRSGGRHLGPEGYNLGLKWQAPEFVKRFYFTAYDHRMPDTYGNAKDFYDPSVPDGGRNRSRDLLQFDNPSASGLPRAGDILVFGAGLFNLNGHVAIITKVTNVDIEIIQQNRGVSSPARERIGLRETKEGWEVQEERVKGWLRKG